MAFINSIIKYKLKICKLPEGKIIKTIFNILKNYRWMCKTKADNKQEKIIKILKTKTTRKSSRRNQIHCLAQSPPIPGGNFTITKFWEFYGLLVPTFFVIQIRYISTIVEYQHFNQQFSDTEHFYCTWWYGGMKRWRVFYCLKRMDPAKEQEDFLKLPATKEDLLNAVQNKF